MATLQLQLFDHITKRYVVTNTESHDLTLADMKRVAKNVHGQPWRICKADRPLKQLPYHTYISKAYSRSIADVQREYVTWALIRGIQITVYAKAFMRSSEVRFPTGSKIITPEEHFAVEESHDA